MGNTDIEGTLEYQKALVEWIATSQGQGFPQGVLDEG